MYRHKNSNIEELDSSHDTKILKPPGRIQREIPLSFTNTPWGQDYKSNPNWERENLQPGNSSGGNFLVGSRFRSPPKETGTIQIKLCDSVIPTTGVPTSLPPPAPVCLGEEENSDESTRVIYDSIDPPPRLRSHRHTPRPPNLEQVYAYQELELPPIRTPQQKPSSLARSTTVQGYSAMESWNQFRRAVESDNYIESEQDFDHETHSPSPASPRPIKRCEWSDVFTRWDDCEQWQLRKPSGALR